jgi:DUF4097 and DUF4098 domain-containing protein YvlB
LVAQSLRGPVLLITLGFLFELHQRGALSFSQTWPLLIIVVGVMKFLERALAPPKVADIPGTRPVIPPQYGVPPAAAPPQYGYRPPSPGVPPSLGVPPAQRAQAMRSGGSIGGPLILIVIGAIFLAHTISPEVPIGSYLAQYWPWLLVIWGGVQILEILVRASSGAWIPDNGISAGGWFLVILICFFGLASYEFRGAGDWWRRAAFERGVQVFGTVHDYQVASETQEAGPAPTIVLDRFRGNARIIGADGNNVVVGGHKTIRSLDIGVADRTNRNTPLTVVRDGDKMVIRCNQDRADSQTLVTTDLELTVPRGASVQVTGRSGNLDVSSIGGNVDISNGFGGVKVSNVDGSVNVDTRQADLIQCSAIKGPIQLRGHGTDVELENISGQVTISGDYGGTIALRAVLKPIRVESMETEVNAQQLPGELKIAPGSVTGQNLIGPVAVTTRATDVDLNGFTDSLNLNVEKGDIELRPLNVPVSKMLVRTRAGNIDLALPESANFQLLANTRRGEIQNDFGGDLTEITEGHGALLKGAVGVGPDLNLETTRGTITVRKAGSDNESEPRPRSHTHPRMKRRQIPVGKSVEL